MKIWTFSLLYYAVQKFHSLVPQKQENQILIFVRIILKVKNTKIKTWLYKIQHMVGFVFPFISIFTLLCNAHCLYPTQVMVGLSFNMYYSGEALRKGIILYCPHSRMRYRKIHLTQSFLNRCNFLGKDIFLHWIWSNSANYAWSSPLHHYFVSYLFIVLLLLLIIIAYFKFTFYSWNVCNSMVYIYNFACLYEVYRSIKSFFFHYFPFVFWDKISLQIWYSIIV